jgi:non-homologous end joining protein Ku
MYIRNAYVLVAVNVPAVTSRYHGAVREISKVTRNKRRLRHIHVKNPPSLCSRPEQRTYETNRDKFLNITEKILMGTPPTSQSSELYDISVIMNVTEIEILYFSVYNA